VTSFISLWEIRMHSARPQGPPTKRPESIEVYSLAWRNNPSSRTPCPLSSATDLAGFSHDARLLSA
jgi:hypothetical protein